jgi:hypothetical protein
LRGGGRWRERGKKEKEKKEWNSHSYQKNETKKLNDLYNLWLE